MRAWASVFWWWPGREGSAISSMLQMGNAVCPVPLAKPTWPFSYMCGLLVSADLCRNSSETSCAPFVLSFRTLEPSVPPPPILDFCFQTCGQKLHGQLSVCHPYCFQRVPAPGLVHMAWEGLGRCKFLKKGKENSKPRSFHQPRSSPSGAHYRRPAAMLQPLSASEPLLPHHLHTADQDVVLMTTEHVPR